jgi:hypothetical protein
MNFFWMNEKKTHSLCCIMAAFSTLPCFLLALQGILELACMSGKIFVRHHLMWWKNSYNWKVHALIFWLMKKGNHCSNEMKKIAHSPMPMKLNYVPFHRSKCPPHILACLQTAKYLKMKPTTRFISFTSNATTTWQA